MSLHYKWSKQGEAESSIMKCPFLVKEWLLHRTLQTTITLFMHRYVSQKNLYQSVLLSSRPNGYKSQLQVWINTSTTVVNAVD